jgi:hypothetical protein
MLGGNTLAACFVHKLHEKKACATPVQELFYNGSSRSML